MTSTPTAIRSPTRNFILQSADHIGEDYVLETKVDVTQLNGGYAQGGILVRTDDDNYVKFDAISDVDNPKFNRIELRSEQAGAILNPQPQVTTGLPATVTDVWLRLTKTGTSYAGEYSWDGGTWTALSARSPTPRPTRRSGSSRSACRSPIASSASSTSRSTARRAARRPSPRTTRRSSSATATPSSGFAPLAVQFAVTATDEDDDDLTYSWDFGDGSAASTAEDPSHTYTTAGTYNAKVTVSDGEDDVTRTVPITVFGADDTAKRVPRARLLQDDGLPARLDPGGHRRDQAARDAEQLPGRRLRGRRACSATTCSRTTTR